MTYYNLRILREKPLVHKIIYFLYHNDDAWFTREHLVRMLAKPRTTIYDNIRIPIALNMIDQMSRMGKGQTKGRPMVFYKLNDEFKKYLRDTDLMEKKVIM